MRRTAIVIIATCLVAIAAFALLRPRSADLAAEAAPVPLTGVETDLARVTVDTIAQTIDIIIGPVTLDPHEDGYRAPIQLVSLPVAGWLRGYSWFVQDTAGQRLSDDILHHVNLIDPDRTELFSPTARRVVAAGRETTPVRMPGLIGYPLAAGTRFLIVTMLSNPEPEPRRVSLTVRLDYMPERSRIQPVAIYPFYLDVMGPVGDKDFAVPPGRTVQSWIATPQVDARILALGGHAHDYATRLELVDETTGKTLWSVTPVTEQGRLIEVPSSMVLRRGGIKIKRDHRYRVSVEYFNPATTPAPHGGMGVVAGVVTTRGVWPALQHDDADYRTDMANIIAAPRLPRSPGGMGGHVH